jgi:drug/metabolite transporter (DMT)-like permease
MEAGRAGVFINLEPVVGAASAMALLGESLTAGAFAGGALILVASGIVTRS